MYLNRNLLVSSVSPESPGVLDGDTLIGATPLFNFWNIFMKIFLKKAIRMGKITEQKW